MTARVLVVEDDPIFRLPLRAALAAAGVTVLVAVSAEAAETMLDHETVDVVLSDLGLPGMDGAALAARHSGIPFVLMTGLPSDHLPRAALPPSVTSCLVKPLDIANLLAVLREAVKAGGDPTKRSGRDPHRAVNSHS